MIAFSLAACKNKDNYTKDEVILVVLTRAATLEFKDYKAKDFLEVCAISVEDLTAETGEIVKRALAGDVAHENLVIVDTFQTILKLVVRVGNKQSITELCAVLELRRDIEYANPNYEISLVN
ncbi:MAG: hypothetical protein LBT20_02515 [Clostridiales bacterium]|jgi:hypothetical protein|nr:hypothetical protein [Clostridiales bacterium]